MNQLKKALIIFICFLSFQVSAQNFPYYFSVGLSPFEPLENATSLNNGGVWNDPTYAIPIGFTFNLLGKTGNTIFMNDFFSGAYMTLNPGAAASNPVIIVYGSHIVDAGLMSGNSLSEISYKQTGTAGNKILKIEWKNVGFYNEMDSLGTNNDRISFQLWLHEGSNDIEMRFGENMVANFDLIHEDIGPLIGFINDYDIFTDEFDKSWLLVGDQTAPIIDTVITNGNPNPQIIGLGTDPEDGRIYRFTTAPYVSVKAPSIDDKVSVYPTLAGEKLFIRFIDIEHKNASAAIYNAFGQLLTTKLLDGYTDYLSLNTLSPGMYFIHIKTEAGEAVKKIVKQ